MSTIGDGAVNLGNVGRVAIVKHTIIYPAAAELRDGSLTFTDCTAHLRVLSIAAGEALYVPMTYPMLRNLGEQAGRVIAGDLASGE